MPLACMISMVAALDTPIDIVRGLQYTPTKEDSTTKIQIDGAFILEQSDSLETSNMAVCAAYTVETEPEDGPEVSFSYMGNKLV